MGRLSDHRFYNFPIDLAHHPATVPFLAAFCVWTSLWLICRLWVKHKNDSFLKRLFWSFILCLPLFGWVAYGAFYQPLASNDVSAGNRWSGGS